ncbi:MAG: ABC transporter permease [Proteobacteria bacterium]|nr:ABC transporter permease [Pseudomonadota bacterium]
MKRYIIVRLFYAVMLLAGVTVIAFIMTRMLPGDPIRAAMQQNMDLNDESIVEEVRAQYGLDRPAHIQFAMWFSDFVTGDWGTSLSSGDKVTAMFLRRVPVTLELALFATLWSWIIGIPLGVISALKRNTWLDTLITGVSVAGLSIPIFWEAILLIYLLAIIFPIFPPSGYILFSDDPWGNIQCIILPTFVMGTHGAAGLARYIRSSLLEVVGQDYIRTARAKGFGGKSVITKHAAKPAMIPIVTVIGMSFGGLFAGAFFIELMFAIPGLGRWGLDAVFNRDFPVIQATVIIGSSTVLIANLITDIAYGYIDPRIRVHR